MIGDDRPPGDDRARTFQPLVPPCPRILPTTVLQAARSCMHPAG